MQFWPCHSFSIMTQGFYVGFNVIGLVLEPTKDNAYLPARALQVKTSDTRIMSGSTGLGN